MNFISLKNISISLGLGLNQLQLKGSLVYEYNPLKVLRANEDIIENGEITYPKGSLINLDTDLLNFDLNHPIDILTQQSYDGSVNLIINDGKNFPKLINTRFSSTGMDTYLIVDREGDNDTNIYDINSFDSDISLYKKTNNIAKLLFTGINTSGNMKVGNYVFYFKLSDSDGNETDFIAESGIVTCHIGNLNDPFSIQGGLRDENSFKSVSFILSDIDSSYNNVVVYYTRSTSDMDGVEMTSSFKVMKQYSVYNNIARINVTGFELVQAVSINEINVAYNVVSNAVSQTTCQNMLFLGNVTNPDINYKELSDLSLHFLPKLNDSNTIGRVNEKYEDPSGGFEYYNVMNIYNKLGYWNDEIYRFGVVYILNDFTLSPVFNIRGINALTKNPNWKNYPIYQGGKRNYIPINNETNKLDSPNENSKGVVKIVYNGNQLQSDKTIPLGLDISINPEAVLELKKYTKGFFFVRQKRIPTTLCQAVTIGLEDISHLPVLPVSDSTYRVERFIDKDRVITHDFDRRSEDISKDSVLDGYAALCPEFEVKQSFFNLLFTGTNFNIRINNSQFKNKYFNRIGTHFFNIDYEEDSSNQEGQYNIMAIGDNVKILKGKKQIFSARAGEAEDGKKLSYYSYTNKSNNATNILRGSWGPYLGLEGYNTRKMSLIDIKIPNYDETLLDSYFEIRYQDASSFYAISDRLLWDDLSSNEITNIFRGDCFISNYTHRMCRNFLDPSAPINDDIVDQMSWKEGYRVSNDDTKHEINRGDVNAVNIGHWATIKVCSNVNLSMRCTNTGYISEMGMSGKPRGFYPLQAMSPTGESKIAESFLINSGNSSTTSDKYYYVLPNMPAIKNKFHIRIMYSDINVNDSFKNGYRVFRLSNYRDYPLTYGSITKLVEWFGNIVCVFEHGVAIIPVNERAVAGQGVGGNVFINTSNVLPENPKMLSDTFGTLWSESVLKTPYYIYGVDTVGKKIWRTNGLTFEVISDFKVLKFLNDNITISEKEKTPIIGIRNVKTHYNNFKHDVMFTFYDDINTLEENVWNLCYNEIMQKFVTFYSWVPSYSENIDNIFFSFDRTTSKTITKLTSNYPLLGLKNGGIISDTLLPSSKVYIGDILLNLDIDNSNIEYAIADSSLRNKFFILNKNQIYISGNSIGEKSWSIPITATIYNNGNELVEGGVKNIVKILYSTITVITLSIYDNLKTLFWKHGKAGLMMTKSKLAPCKWYGKLHPFEFEFIVVDNPSIHKIFDNLLVISNKALPESFHFEVIGEVYNFAKDKENMYFRLEATKHLYLYNGANIIYNHDYLDIIPKQRTIPRSNSEYMDISAMFPLKYSRVDTFDDIYDHYLKMTSKEKIYQYMQGSEIVHDDLLGEFKILTHVKAKPFGYTYDMEITKLKYDILKERDTPGLFLKDGKYYLVVTYGRINGNIDYKEDRWDMQIPPINYWAKNERQWNIGNNIKYPPLNLANNPLPEDITSLDITDDSIPKQLYDLGYRANLLSLDINKWPESQMQTKMRDKYIKIKVRYSGKDLAVITALRTLYTISYA